MMDASRYDINHQVRMVLNRHYIDLTRIDYSCIGHTVYLSGELRKTSEDDLVPPVIESLLKEIARLSNVHSVQCAFQNWNISSDENAWQITKSKKKLYDTFGVPEFQQGGVMSEAAEEVYIKTSEKITDVLKDMKKKPEQED
jgi:hypothetical protein